MTNVWNTVAVIALGGFGWFVTQFVGSPIRKFFDLRGDVIHKAILFFPVAAVQKEFLDGSIRPEKVSDEDVERLREAQEVFRDLGARMRAFALNERLALLLVQWRYDLWRASETLFRVANTLPTYGLNRAEAKQELERSLNFRITEPQGTLLTSLICSWGVLKGWMKSKFFQ